MLHDDNESYNSSNTDQENDESWPYADDDGNELEEHGFHNIDDDIELDDEELNELLRNF